MARQIGEQGHGRPLPSGTSTAAGAASRWLRLLAPTAQDQRDAQPCAGRLAMTAGHVVSCPSARASHGGKTVPVALVTRALDNYLGVRATRPAR